LSPINIGMLGLPICRECKQRFDCILRPKPNSVHHDHPNQWIMFIAGSSPRHPIDDFDGFSIFAEAPCIGRIEEKYFYGNWKETNGDVVILSGTFINELLEYARYNYPNFERRE
jgi:hypothetical protein